MHQQVTITPRRIQGRQWKGSLIATNPITDDKPRNAKIAWDGAPASVADESAAGHIVLKPGFALVLPLEKGAGWSKLPVAVSLDCVSLVGGANA